MLTHNLDVKDSLTNGAVGEVLDYRYDGNGRVSDIIIEFFNPKVGANRRKRPENAELLTKYPGRLATPIGRVEFEYRISRNAKITLKSKVIQF